MAELAMGHAPTDYSSTEEVFSKKIYAGRRTYYLDVKVTSKNDKYLVISEKRRSSREDGKSENDRIMIFKEDFHKFFDRIDEIRDWLEEQPEA